MAAALLLLTGCSEEVSTLFHPSGDGITAVVDNGQTQMRSTMIDSPTQGVDFYWSAGDAIGIFDDSHQNARFTAAASDIATDSATAVFKSGGGVPKEDFIAYYPYSAGVKYDGHSKLTLTMPSTQHYVEYHYKVQPDANVNIMVGEGFSNNVTFKNVFAILKVGYVPANEDKVEQVAFSDLSGQPVSGAFTVSMQDGVPTAVFPATGDGATLALDCGDGVEVDPTNIASFFLVVPARDYKKGFQLAFRLASGATDTRTIGKTAGKTLLRSMVYSVGDVSVITKDDYTVNFGETGGTIMDDDLMAMVQSVKSLGYQYEDNETYGDFYELVVRKGTSLEAGQSLVINRTSEALPYGLIGRIVSITPGNDVDILRVMQYGNAAEAFKSLTIGKEDVISADGSLNEDAVVPLDLTRYYTRFEPSEGYEDVDITLEGHVLNISGEAPLESRRASGSTMLSLPHMSIVLKNDDRNTVTIGAQAQMKMAVGASITDYTLHYLAVSLTPTLTVDLSVQKKREGELADKEWKIGRMYFAPITVGPVVTEPFADVYIYATLKGAVELTAKWNYTMGLNLGAMYSRTYNGDQIQRGVAGHIQNVSDDLPAMGDLFFPDEVSSSFGAEAQGGLKLNVGCSLYRILDFTTYVKGGLSLQGGVSVSSVAGGWNGSLKLSPAVEGGLRVFGEEFPLATVDFDPFWRRDFYPFVHMLSKTYGNKADAGTTAFPYTIYLYGNIMADMKIDYEIYSSPKGMVSLGDYGDLIGEGYVTHYQGSPLVGGNAADYDRLEIEKTFNINVEKDKVYTILFKCYPLDSRSPCPAAYCVGINRRYIQIHYETQKYTDSDGVEHEEKFILMDDGNGRWIQDNNGIWQFYPNS